MLRQCATSSSTKCHKILPYDHQLKESGTAHTGYFTHLWNFHLKIFIHCIAVGCLLVNSRDMMMKFQYTRGLPHGIISHNQSLSLQLEGNRKDKSTYFFDHYAFRIA